MTTLPADDTGTSPSPAGVPKIPKELDASRLLDAPCDSLTPNNLVGLDPSFAAVAGTGDISGPGYTACGWTNPDLSEAIDITFATFATNGLDTIYQEQSEMAYWQPITVDGYPAVEASQYDGRPHGLCVVDTAVNDHLYFFAQFRTFNADQRPQSCTIAAKAAGDVITNLQGGG